MFCEPYKKSLTDAATAGESPSYPLQRHLASCKSCRDAFAEEQSFFAAIDSGLRTAANTEVPATLLPRVRAGILAAPPPRRFSFSIVALAGAAVAATAIIVSFLLQSHTPPIRTAVNRTSASLYADKPNPVSPAIVNPRSARGVSSLQHGAPATLAAGRSAKPKSPEVIVAPEDGAALLRYEMLLRKARAARLPVESANPLDRHLPIEPLEIADIELGDLNIPSLAKSDQEGDTK
ncbi:MAG TPA: hypothetical protein VKP58_13385 [Candidatus Acidoferrum sp.]|nr:hypothetical protein [Candidatus Acidoferrum sp.]